MTNSINVPRELLAELQEHIDCHRDAVLWGKVCDLLSAPSPANHVEDVRAMVADPSPAGVDGLEVVGWYRMDDRKAITPYPSVCATWHKMGVKVGAAYSDSAHAIIDGLRGENERIRLNIAEYNEAIACYQSERDQHAKRIGELEGLLRSCLPALSDGGCAALANSIDAALAELK